MFAFTLLDWYLAPDSGDLTGARLIEENPPKHFVIVCNMYVLSSSEPSIYKAFIYTSLYIVYSVYISVSVCIICVKVSNSSLSVTLGEKNACIAESAALLQQKEEELKQTRGDLAK